MRIAGKWFRNTGSQVKTINMIILFIMTMLFITYLSWQWY